MTASTRCTAKPNNGSGNLTTKRCICSLLRHLQANSSIGRAAVSKTAGWGFEPLLACQSPGFVGETYGRQQQQCNRSQATRVVVHHPRLLPRDQRGDEEGHLAES